MTSLLSRNCLERGAEPVALVALLARETGRDVGNGDRDRDGHVDADEGPRLGDRELHVSAAASQLGRGVDGRAREAVEVDVGRDPFLERLPPDAPEELP